jgi:hypothetical protein
VRVRVSGTPGSAHPAREHDWVHVLADYGTVEAKIEVFGFIARASDARDVFASRR